VVVLIEVVLVVGKMIRKHLDDTSKHEESFKGGIQTVYKERLFGIGGFPFLLSLLGLPYKEASIILKQLGMLAYSDSLKRTSSTLVLNMTSRHLLSISPTPHPACYIGMNYVDVQFGKLVRKLNAQSENIYNMDGKGFLLGQALKVKVICHTN